MPGKTIRINDTEFTLPSGSPFEFPGIHSGGELSGIELNVTAYSDVEAHEIEEILKEKTVSVDDPFADRQYEAVLIRRSSGYQEGRPERWYHFELKEMDESPKFTILEIDGHRFHVLKNTEDQHDQAIGMHILLRLSPDEFLHFRRLLKPGPVAIQRIGIDEKPIIRRFGGAQYWSSHNEGSQKFYKHIVRFYPTDLSGARGAIASANEQIAQSEMILALSARFEALVRILTEGGQISQENAETLIAKEWRGLIDDNRELVLRSTLKRVDDAELELH